MDETVKMSLESILNAESNQMFKGTISDGKNKPRPVKLYSQPKGFNRDVYDLVYGFRVLCVDEEVTEAINRHSIDNTDFILEIGRTTGMYDSWSAISNTLSDPREQIRRTLERGDASEFLKNSYVLSIPIANTRNNESSMYAFLTTDAENRILKSKSWIVNVKKADGVVSHSGNEILERS